MEEQEQEAKGRRTGKSSDDNAPSDIGRQEGELECEQSNFNDAGPRSKKPRLEPGVKWPAMYSATRTDVFVELGAAEGTASRVGIFPQGSDGVKTSSGGTRGFEYHSIDRVKPTCCDSGSWGQRRSSGFAHA
jgi:hypothetical protein